MTLKCFLIFFRIGMVFPAMRSARPGGTSPLVFHGYEGEEFLQFLLMNIRSYKKNIAHGRLIRRQLAMHSVRKSCNSGKYSIKAV